MSKGAPYRRLPRHTSLMAFAEKHGITLTVTQAKTILKREKTIANSRNFITALVKAHTKKLNG